MKRTTNFVISAVDATPDAPVLFVEVQPDEVVTEPLLSLARLDDIERLKRDVRAATLADALPALRELAKAHISMLDDDDVIIKVSPGRAAWVISRIRALMASESEQESGDGGH